MPFYSFSSLFTTKNTHYLWGRVGGNMVLTLPKTFSRYKNVHLLPHWSLGHCDIVNPEIKNRHGGNSCLESSTDPQ